MKHTIYEQKSHTKLILIFGIPSILSLMVEMMTGIVDTAFAGNLPGMGDSALSALALIAPLQGVFTALQTLFAMSTGLLIAKYLNDAREKNQSFITGIFMSAILAAVTSALCSLILPDILSLLGAKGQIFQAAKRYLQIQLLSNLFSSVGYTLTCCIRAFGFPKTEVAIVTGAVAVKILSNLVFIVVFKMEMAGLAWGTFVSECVCALCAMLFLMKKKLWLFKPLSLRCFFQRAWELFKIGIAQTATQILGGCTGLIVNARLLALGSLLHVAAWNIVQHIYTFTLVPIVGMTQGVQTIISYYSGNGTQETIKKISKRTMLLCGGYGTIALLLMMRFGHHLISAFGGSSEMIAIAQIILRIVFLGFPLIGILYTDMTLLQVTKHEFASVLLILSRQVFFLIPLIYLIPSLISLSGRGYSSVFALFFCMPLADLLSAAFASIVKKRIVNL